MSTALICLALLAPAASLEPGWHHRYEGQLTDRDENVAKQFTLNCIVTAGSVYWTVEEQGAGQWPWSSRYGKWTPDAPAESLPALLLKTDDFTSVIELPSPRFAAPKTLELGAVWSANGRNYKVGKTKGEWRVSSRNAYGAAEEFVVAEDQPLIRTLRRDLVVGRGDRYQLNLQLADSQRLETGDIESAQRQYELLIGLRDELKRPARVRENQWTKEQMATLKSSLPTDPAPGLKAVLAAAALDVREQGTRSNALKEMNTKAIGKVPTFVLELAKLGGGSVSSEQLRGRAVVLHIWTYQSKPLEEPYGQVGYLDFLARKLPADKAAVLGVVAHRPDQSAKDAAREARKLIQFMNLGFPVAVDDGALLDKLGDPRQAGGGLPLFVVLDPAGKVVHYHVGHYEVDRLEGLKELAEIVERALPK
ncbi:MAG: TlpA family protein disulfide reductase [Planctomycetales bacterium]|nr:TlpA family protein disulfide reductase [Planctomycetales bacterium]